MKKEHGCIIKIEGANFAKIKVLKDKLEAAKKTSKQAHSDLWATIEDLYKEAADADRSQLDVKYEELGTYFLKVDNDNGIGSLIGEIIGSGLAKEVAAKKAAKKSGK